MQPQQKQHYTFAEYETLERETGERFLYYYGEVFAMAGTTLGHNRIVLNTAFLLEEKLPSKNCQVFAENVKLELAHEAYYVYPDVLVTCHKEDITDFNKTIVKYPSLIVEVFSESTQSYDMQEKKTAYFKIPTLQYYSLIYPKKPCVEVFERNGDFWIFRIYENLQDVIALEKLNATLPLERIYRDLKI
ncbi:MAG: Uma2 family endonuclease [Raineya sp.]|nr:Uma2 family endonuclease [Raineya sp.]